MDDEENKSRMSVVPAAILAAEQPPPGLAPNHLRELRASGLTDETIRAAGIYSENSPATIRNLLDCNANYVKKLAPAMVFPYRDSLGQFVCSRIKPDSPRVDRNGKPVKYESPRQQPNRLYLPPGIVPKLADVGCELLITEGEKKTLAAMQAGFACLGLVGVYGWKQKDSQSLLPGFALIAWQGRRVSIVFDSDISHKPEVLQAETKLAAHLAKLGAIVRVARLPDGPADAEGKPVKLGLDDYLQLQGVAGLREVLDNASEPEPLLGDTVKLPGNSIDPATEAERFLSQHKHDGHSIWVYHRGEFFRWNRGRYEPWPVDAVKSAVMIYLNDSFCRVWPQHNHGVVEQFKAQTHIAEAVEAPAWLGNNRPWPLDSILATRSQVIHLPSLIQGKDSMLAATPELYIHNALDFEFDPEAPPPQLWEAKLAEWFDGDQAAIETLQEIFGYLLTGDTSQQKIFLLIGPPRSGKGTIARVLQSLIGPGNCIGVTFQQLTTQFGLQSFLGKSLAIFNDARFNGINNESVVVERLISISGEDSLTVERKFREPITAKLPSRLLIVSNELPKLRDASGALASRMVVLNTRASFAASPDHELTGKLLLERKGILLWAIAGWERLRSRGRFEQPANGKELLGELHDLVSPVGQFVRECCEVGPAKSVRIDDLFAAWVAWCTEQGRDHPGTKQTFGRDLRAVVPNLTTPKLRDGSKRETVYNGIGLQA